MKRRQFGAMVATVTLSLGGVSGAAADASTQETEPLRVEDASVEFGEVTASVGLAELTYQDGVMQFRVEDWTMEAAGTTETAETTERSLAIDAAEATVDDVSAETYATVRAGMVEAWEARSPSPLLDALAGAEIDPDASVEVVAGPISSDDELVADEVRATGTVESVVPEGEFSDTIGAVGELLVTGPNVVEGYWNKSGETEAAFEEIDGERWFRTGDVVQQRPDGYLTFRERSKQICVLSTGKNVAPGPIEDGFSAGEVVEQCMVVGDGRKFVSAIVVPNFEGLRAWAERHDLDIPDEPAEMVEDGSVRERIQRAVDDVNEEFEPHERIKTFALVPEAFTEDNDLLTPTLKKKRRTIRAKYEEEVEAMYQDAEPVRQ
jgi:long-chain acyl-CoA synthetase